MPRYLENTYLALRLATHCRVRIMAEPTIVWNTDTPLSVTRSREYTLGQVAALERILELDMPADVRASFRRAISLACHANAELCMREGDIDQASAWHRRSLREPGGWRHLLFTRQLLRLPRD
jgi:hypothetical protein